jgi:UDP-GlcNAc:undecaprenyl-phosphate/decaprenyl-phosphate GlcNAc-1-phosphate transferase
MLVNCLLIFLMTLVLVILSIKKLIRISHIKHLFDEPYEARKVHTTSIPNLGGVAIFGSMMFTSFLFLPAASIYELKYLIISSVVIFILGVTDDLVGVNPLKKIIPQLGVALLTTLWGGVRFTSFYDLLGLTAMPYTVSIVVSVLFILLLINAFNLIDGINCLAASIGLLACLVFGYYFWRIEQTGLLFLSIAMCGCLVGFLFFNRTPAKIFMGDAGSLFLGFIVAVFSINFIELTNTGSFQRPGQIFMAPPAIVFSLIIVPFFDTLRVFSLRLWKGKSPFLADRNHIHHRLLDLNLSHIQATGTLVLVTLISLSLAVFLPGFGTSSLLALIAVFILLFNSAVGIMLARKRNKFRQASYPEKNITEFETLFYQEKPHAKTMARDTTVLDEPARIIELNKSSKKATEVV